LFSQFHQPIRLAISLRICHTKPAALPALRITSLLMPHNYYRLTIYGCQSANNRLIITVKTVAVQFGEVFSNKIDIIQGVWPVGMPRQLHPLPSGEVGKYGSAQFINPFLESLNLRDKNLIVGNVEVAELF